MTLQLVASCLLGTLLGVRHAFEPDHLAAVANLVVGGASPRRAAWLGLSWGAGHGLALLLASGALLVTGRAMDPRVEAWLEMGVATMVVGLGLRSLQLATRPGPAGEARPHRHGPRVHVHAAAAPHVHLGRLVLARRPLAVGVVHGLAGSGALTVLALSQAGSVAEAGGTIALFGLGSAGAMAVGSGAMGWLLARPGRPARLHAALLAATGGLSVGVGLSWGWHAFPRAIGLA